LARDLFEQTRHLLRVGSIAGEGACSDFAAQRGKLLRLARSQGDAHAFMSE
jgi:hypothetical protein